MGKSKVNREYKDRLFKYIFGNPEKKEWTLSLFNAVSGLNCTNPEEITMTTLDNVVYMGMRNDLSFLICDTMNFYEQQSTFNPNMPVRFLLYGARVYESYIEASDEYDLYGSKLHKLPAPKCICFYNGKDKTEDTSILKLSDCFNGDTTWELEVTMLNINFGHNKLLDKCKPLMEYSSFVNSVRIFKKKLGNIEPAVYVAINNMPDDSLLKKFLMKNKAEVTAMCLTEFDLEKTLKNRKKEGIEEGIEIGRKEGHKEGREEGHKEGREEGRKEGREEGRKEGREEGRKEGREEGREEGRKEGREEGREEGKVITMVELIANGTLSLDDAASAIGMSKAHFIDAANRLGLKLK